MRCYGIVPLPVSVVDNRAAAFEPVGGRAPLAHVVHTLSATGPVVVAAAGPLVEEVRACLAGNGLSAAELVVAGAAATRAECLAAALDDAPDQVLVHDIAHPLAPSGLAARVVAAVRGGADAVVPAVPVTDSVKVVDPNGTITGALDRERLRAVQYPRGYTTAVLRALLADHTAEDGDELAVALRTGVPVTFVEGDPDAFRVRLPHDGAFAAAVIADRRVS